MQLADRDPKRRVAMAGDIHHEDRVRVPIVGGHWRKVATYIETELATVEVDHQRRIVVTDRLAARSAETR